MPAAPAGREGWRPEYGPLPRRTPRANRDDPKAAPAPPRTPRGLEQALVSDESQEPHPDAGRCGCPKSRTHVVRARAADAGVNHPFVWCGIPVRWRGVRVRLTNHPQDKCPLSRPRPRMQAPAAREAGTANAIDGRRHCEAKKPKPLARAVGGDRVMPETVGPIRPTTPAPGPTHTRTKFERLHRHDYRVNT